MDPAVFLTGILIGTGLLSIGLSIGWYFGQRSGPAADAKGDPLVQRQVLEAIRNFASWTTELSGDFSKYNAKLASLSKHAEATAAGATKDEIRLLLGEILHANRSLQDRLDSAEDRLERQTRELSEYLTEARTDALTGLPNRRAFDQGLDDCLKRWHQERIVFCLALMDIDFFKSINDNCGHAAGDAVLVEVAARLQAFAAGDFQLGRYGGEEFAVILPLPLRQAAAQLERLRLQIAGRPFAAAEPPLRVTASFGVSEIRGDERLGDIFRRSDEALYSAKIAGRNRVFIHNGTICEPFGSPAGPEHPRFGPPRSSEDEAAAAIDSPLQQTRDRIQARFDEIVARELQRP